MENLPFVCEPSPRAGLPWYFGGECAMVRGERPSAIGRVDLWRRTDAAENVCSSAHYCRRE
jgi:hypothetical protein